LKTLICLTILGICILTTDSVAQSQGICGSVLWVQGNQMPGPDKSIAAGKGVKREVHIFQKTTVNQTTQQGVFFSEIKTPKVKVITTKRNGSFKVKLEPGTYSLFVKEEEGLFANSFDGQQCIQCITVNPGKFSKTTIEVNYKAAY
jgi:hypothetical protein